MNKLSTYQSVQDQVASRVNSYLSPDGSLTSSAVTPEGRLKSESERAGTPHVSVVFYGPKVDGGLIRSELKVTVDVLKWNEDLSKDKRLDLDLAEFTRDSKGKVTAFTTFERAKEKLKRYGAENLMDAGLMKAVSDQLNYLSEKGEITLTDYKSVQQGLAGAMMRFVRGGLSRSMSQEEVVSGIKLRLP